MSIIRFWLDMARRLNPSRDDKLLIGNIENGQAEYIELPAVLKALTTDDLPESASRKYYTLEMQEEQETFLKEVKETTDSISAGEGGITYDTLLEAQNLDPKPGDGTVFQVSKITDPEKAGRYSFQSSEPSGTRFERSFLTIEDTNTAQAFKQIAAINGTPIKETLTQLNIPFLDGNELVLKFKNENGVEQTVSVDLGALRTVDVNIESATYDAATNIIHLTESDGTVHQIDLSEFSIITNTDSQGITTLVQEGTVKLVISKVGQSGEFGDLLGKTATPGQLMLGDGSGKDTGDFIPSDTTDYLKRDGSLPMTGDLNVQNIFSAELITNTSWSWYAEEPTYILLAERGAGSGISVSGSLHHTRGGGVHRPTTIYFTLQANEDAAYTHNNYDKASIDRIYTYTSALSVIKIAGVTHNTVKYWALRIPTGSSLHSGVLHFIGNKFEGSFLKGQYVRASEVTDIIMESGTDNVYVDGKTLNYVNLDTAQTITGAKTFTSKIDVPSLIVGKNLSYPLIEFGADGDNRYLLRSGDHLKWRYNGINDATIYHQNNLDPVTINTSQTITGTKTFSNSITAPDFVGSSDRRLKENIQPLSLKRIEGEYKTFNFKGNKQARVGRIAQELEETNPEFVRTDKKGFKSISYSDLHSAEIAYLKQQNHKLEERLAKLETLVKNSILK